MRPRSVTAWAMGRGPIMRAMKRLSLLEKILESGIDEKIAIKTINSILSLRTTDEIYSTLDLSIIDLQDASLQILEGRFNAKFYQAGRSSYESTGQQSADRHHQ
nr:hypothetical protein [Bacillus velezensis]